MLGADARTRNGAIRCAFAARLRDLWAGRSQGALRGLSCAALSLACGCLCALRAGASALARPWALRGLSAQAARLGARRASLHLPWCGARGRAAAQARSAPCGGARAGGACGGADSCGRACRARACAGAFAVVAACALWDSSHGGACACDRCAHGRARASWSLAPAGSRAAAIRAFGKRASAQPQGRVRAARARARGGAHALACG